MKLVRLFALGCVLGAHLGATSRVVAQEWLADRSRREGPGLRVGDLEIHPGVGVEAGWDSNVFLSSDNPVSSGILRVTPHVYLSTLGEQRRDSDRDADGVPPPVAFRGGVFGSYYEYFDDSGPDNLALGGDVNLDVLPERPFSFSVVGDYRRLIRPFAERGDGSEDYAVNRGRAGALLRYSSPGEVFVLEGGYRFRFRLFEGTDFSYANSFGHIGEINNIWRFLPATALVFSATVERGLYPDASDARPEAALVSDFTFITTKMGVNGALTNNVSFQARVGYAGGFLDDGQLAEFNDFVANLEVVWEPIRPVKLTIGYDRNYVQSVVGGFFRQDRGFLTMQAVIARAFLVGVEGSLAGLSFGRMVAADGNELGTDGTTGAPTDARSDVRPMLSLFAEYRFTDWLALNFTVAYTSINTDFEFRQSVDGVVVPDAANFDKVDVFGGVRAFY